MPNLLEEVEGQIDKRIQAIEAINVQTHVLNFSFFIVVSLCILVAVYRYQFIYLFYVLILLFKNVILAISICKFLSFTRTRKEAIPNQNLIFLHFANMVIYMGILFVTSTLNELHEHWKDDDQKKTQAIETRLWL